MTTDRAHSEMDRLFPEDRCVPVIAELNAWTSLQAILAAARHLEDRSLPTDQIESGLIMPMPLGDVFEWIFLKIIPWMVAAYQVPPAKIAMARALDPAIRNSTVERLRSARFSPSISKVRAGLVRGQEAMPADSNIFLVADEPCVIEMVQGPLICLTDILTFSFKSAAGARKLQVEAKERTGGAPTIFHRAYSDSRLFATLEALCYHVFDFPLGMPTLHSSGAIDQSYRAVNVQGRPPIAPGSFQRARELMEALLHGLA